MSRFWVILFMGIFLAALLAVAVRWLWRLMGFNNDAATRFADVKQVLQAARDRVRSRLPAQP